MQLWVRSWESYLPPNHTAKTTLHKAGKKYEHWSKPIWYPGFFAITVNLKVHKWDKKIKPSS